MFSILIISILFKLQFVSCTYLEAAANYKPQVERNNIVNKGIWVRNKSNTNLFDKTSLGDVIFRPNSLDADRLTQTNYEPFADNAVEDSRFLPSFFDRVRRSTEQIHKTEKGKSKKTKHVKSTDSTKTEQPMNSNQKPSVFTNYPYDVAIVLNTNRKDLTEAIHSSKNNTNNNETNSNENSFSVDSVINTIQNSITSGKDSESKVSVPKRDKKNNYSIDEPLNIINDVNTTDTRSSKPNRNSYDSQGIVWHQNAPIPDSNIYQVENKVITKEKSKVSERSLIKIISTLTKSFKKIMKQHNEVKHIYNKFQELNDEFTKQVAEVNIKFQDFDSKYLDMIQFNEKLKIFEDKLTNEDEFVTNKHREWENSINEFHNQQKQFLSQQKQFYTIQKVMLAQNEKINQKQSTIAKSQSEISLRQNHFARILKKAKQLFNNNKINNTHVDHYKVLNDLDTKTEYITTPIQTTTENVQFNLFSIPIKAKLKNQDHLIIKEKDDRPIDELVYKFYFNNTLIDNLMKNKILNDFTTNTNSIELARNAKTKRNELDTTILYPVSNKDNIRVRRWLNSWNTFVAKDDGKAKVDKKNEPAKPDPFFTMTSSFCNEIGQNRDEQSFKWCIEKALRRLRFMDKKLFSKPGTLKKDKKSQILPQAYTTQDLAITTVPIPLSTMFVTPNANPVMTPLPVSNQKDMFFPDNEELEDNLKQFDLTPDTEGNVYYDGSLHLSDIEHIKHTGKGHAGMSVFMSGLPNSDSHAELNPVALDLQARRREYVKQINEDIMRRVSSRKL